jgi:Calx-beta domain
LTVHFTITGTATNGADYTTIPTSVMIPAGQLSVTVTVSPIDDLLVEPEETVVLRLAANSAYRIGNPAADTVEIRDNDVNTPPVLAPIADQTVPASQQVVMVPLSATDANGDPITFSATAQSLAYSLKVQYALFTDGQFNFNAIGMQEKWLQGNGDGRYYILANGELYQWHANGAPATLLGNVGTSYYEDPMRLVNAAVNDPHATLSISGNVLTITRDLSWVSAVLVTVTASDGRGGIDTKTFIIFVTG